MGAATQLRLCAATIGALVVCVLAALAILIINGFDVEEFGQGGPFVGLVLLVPVAIGLIAALVWLDEKAAWVRGEEHKLMSAS